jgi:hypothetical protein
MTWEPRASIMVEALCYKLEGRGFETQLGNWMLTIYPIFPAAPDSGVYQGLPDTEIKCVWGVERPVREADNLASICEPIV